MKEQFVTYEIAILLKELRFDEECLGYYTKVKSWMIISTILNPEPHFSGPNWTNDDNSMYFMYKANSFGDRDSIVKNSEFTKSKMKNVAVPLWQQLTDWLYKNYGILITTYLSPDKTLFWIVRTDKEDFYTSKEQATLKALQYIKSINLNQKG